VLELNIDSTEPYIFVQAFPGAAEYTENLHKSHPEKKKLYCGYAKEQQKVIENICINAYYGLS
jgi:hypothetical protein